MMTTITKPGRLAAVSRSPMDPERSSPGWLGSGLLIRAPRGSTPPGSSKRRPLKSEVRGSSPRSCSNSVR
jgi:hypothetical protein